MFELVLTGTGITVFWPGIILLGIFIGFLTGMYGVGGGFLLVPFLKIFFGIPYPLAVGCSLVLMFFNSITVVILHWKKGSVDPLLGGIIGAGAVIGTEFGIRIIKSLEKCDTVIMAGKEIDLLSLVLNIIFLILMVLVGITMYLKTSGARNREKNKPKNYFFREKIMLPPVLGFKQSSIDKMSIWLPFICALGIGVFTGLLGIGGGIIYLPLLIYIIGTPTLVAVGTISFQRIFSCFYGSVRYFKYGNINFIIFGLLFIGSLVGVKVGAQSAYFFGERKIQRSFIIIIAIGIVVVIWDIIKNVSF